MGEWASTDSVHCAGAAAAAVTRREEKPEREEFALGSELGRGNYSTVYRALHRVTGEVFALKVVDKGRVQRLQHRHKNIHGEILMERNLLRRLRHPNVIRLFHTFQVRAAGGGRGGRRRGPKRPPCTAHRSFPGHCPGRDPPVLSAGARIRR